MDSAVRVWLREFGVSFFPGAELFTEGGLEIWGGERMHCACGHRCHPSVMVHAG